MEELFFFNISKAKQSMICEWLTDKFGLELGSYHEEMNVILGNNINEQGFDEFIVDYTDIDTIHNYMYLYGSIRCTISLSEIV